MKICNDDVRVWSHRARARTIGTMVAICAALAASPASGGDVDTVWMTNGGRVRGVVMVDDAQGVSVKLSDGTVRRLTRAEVTRVEYAADAAPSPAPSAPAPAPAPEAPPAAPPPAAVPAAPPAALPSPFAVPAGDAPVYERRSPGLMVTGLVLMPLGAVALANGIGLVAASDDAISDYAYGCMDCSTDDDDMAAAGGATAVAGGVLLATGIVFTAVGASKKRVGPTVGVGPRGISLAGRF